MHPCEICWVVEHHFANLFLCSTVWIILFVFWPTHFNHFYQHHMSVWYFMWKTLIIISNLLIPYTVLSITNKGVLALCMPVINCAVNYCVICSWDDSLAFSGQMQNILPFNLFCFFNTAVLNTRMLYLLWKFYFMPPQRI